MPNITERYYKYYASDIFYTFFHVTRNFAILQIFKIVNACERVQRSGMERELIKKRGLLKLSGDAARGMTSIPQAANASR